jgi:hypothetical protein
VSTTLEQRIAAHRARADEHRRLAEQQLTYARELRSIRTTPISAFFAGSGLGATR